MTMTRFLFCCRSAFVCFSVRNVCLFLRAECAILRKWDTVMRSDRNGQEKNGVNNNTPTTCIPLLSCWVGNGECGSTRFSCSSGTADDAKHGHRLCFFYDGAWVAMIVDTKPFTMFAVPHPKPSFLLSRGWVFENFSISAYGSLLYSRRLKLPFSAFLGIMGTWGKRRRTAVRRFNVSHTGVN